MDPEPNRSEPPTLPRPPIASDWHDRLRGWRERSLDLMADQVAVRAVVTLVALIAVAAVAIVLVRQPGAGAPLEAALPTVEPFAAPVAPLSSTPETPATIVVHVAGAVGRPGLVELPTGSRVADAIAAAGGALPLADLDRVNLAALVSDSERIAVPIEGEEAPALVASAGGVEAVSGPVDLNTASAEALQQLPGIGPATAAAIVAHRDENGPFASVSALDDVAGIGPAKLGQLRDLVTVSP